MGYNIHAAVCRWWLAGAAQLGRLPAWPLGSTPPPHFEFRPLCWPEEVRRIQNATVPSNDSAAPPPPSLIKTEGLRPD